MWKFGKKKLKEAEEKLDKLSKEDIKNSAKDVTGAVIINGVEVAKTGIFGIVNGIIIKILIGFTLIVMITVGGCVATDLTIDSIKSITKEVK